MDRKKLPEILIEEIRNHKVRVNLRTHPSVKFQHNVDEEFDGNISIKQLIDQLKLHDKLKLQQTQNILCYLQSCFLANPFEKIYDLQQCFGSMNKQGKRELFITLALENAWG